MDKVTQHAFLIEFLVNLTLEIRMWNIVQETKEALVDEWEFWSY